MHRELDGVHDAAASHALVEVAQVFESLRNALDTETKGSSAGEGAGVKISHADYADFNALLMKEGTPLKRLHPTFEEVDTSGDGCISKEEFYASNPDAPPGMFETAAGVSSDDDLCQPDEPACSEDQKPEQDRKLEQVEQLPRALSAWFSLISSSPSVSTSMRDLIHQRLAQLPAKTWGTAEATLRTLDELHDAVGSRALADVAQAVATLREALDLEDTAQVLSLLLSLLALLVHNYKY